MTINQLHYVKLVITGRIRGEYRGSHTRLGATALATKWYLCMAQTHWQIEVQALETFEIAVGVKSSLSMYGWIFVITLSGMLS